jgi:hypothetical protein
VNARDPKTRGLVHGMDRLTKMEDGRWRQAYPCGKLVGSWIGIQLTWDEVNCMACVAERVS